MEPYVAIILGLVLPVVLGLGALISLPFLIRRSSLADGQGSGMVLEGIAWFLVSACCLVLSFATAHLVDPLIVLAIVCGMAYSKHVTTQRYALLGLMAVAAGRSMPLTPAVQAFACERGGWFGRRVQRLAGALVDGVPLPDAVELVPGALPEEAVPLVRVGHESGTLAPALRQASASRNLLEPVWQTLVPKIGYACLLPWIGVSIVTFIMLKIVPQFEKIFKDFGTKLPAMTTTLISVARSGGWLTPLFTIAFLMTAGLAVYMVLRYAGAIRWDLPGTSRLTRRLDAAAILDALAVTAASEKPMVRGLAALVRSYPKPPIRRRLHRVLEEVAAGADWCESLRRHRLIRGADVAVLQAAARVGNLPWAMREMADSNRRRFTYRTHALVQVLFPLLVLAYGLVGMFIVVALFLPLVSLINNLTQ